MTPAPPARMPYPGLRPFRREETDLFFGREDCISTMVDRLASTRFLAVLGSSGTGKSSLVKTGLLDALELGLMAAAGSTWRVVDFRPGGTPLRNFARRLLETEDGAVAGAPAESAVDILRAFLARGPRALAEWCREGHLPADTNLLLLVDQFEELFRYQDYAGREEAEAFAALLTESARVPGLPIYVTLTMRSEYLGACALIENLAEAISAGIFLTPRMTRQQCRDAIVGPAEVCGVEIEPGLVNRLLNDLSAFAPWDDHTSRDQLNRLARRADQLPLLQYCLNLIWMRARNDSGGGVTLTLAAYERVGGLGGALNAHANGIFDGLDAPLKPVAERVFRALTEGTSVTDAVRRPTPLGDLIAICGDDAARVRAVVDIFRAPGCNFLTPEPDPKDPKPLDPAAFIDISHESLIRQWRMLSAWLEKEARAARLWRRLKERFEDRQPMHATEVTQMLAWSRDEQLNPAWARRYGGDFAGILKHLDNCDRRLRRFAPLVLPAVGFCAFWGVVAAIAGMEQLVPALLEADKNTNFAVGNALAFTVGLTSAFGLWRYSRLGRIRIALAAAIIAALGVAATVTAPAWVCLFAYPVAVLIILAAFEPSFRRLIGWVELLVVSGAMYWVSNKLGPQSPWSGWAALGWPFWLAVIGDQLRRGVKTATVPTADPKPPSLWQRLRVFRPAGGVPTAANPSPSATPAI